MPLLINHAAKELHSDVMQVADEVLSPTSQRS